MSALAIIAVGCGSGSDAARVANTPTTGAPSTTDVIASLESRAPADPSPERPDASIAARADRLCVSFDDLVADNGPLQIEGFDPVVPDPSQLPLVAAHFGPVLDAAERLSIQLAALTGGTDEEQALLAEFVEALDAENTNARAQADAALRSDSDAFTATLPMVETLTAARQAAAARLGASNCANP